MAWVAELVRETSCIEMRATWAVIMDQAVKRELGALQIVECWQLAHNGILEHYAEKRIRIRGASGDIDDRLARDDGINTGGTSRIGISRRYAAPGSARAHGNDRRSFGAHFLKDIHSGTTAELHVNALLFGRDRAFNHEHEFSGILGDG